MVIGLSRVPVSKRQIQSIFVIVDIVFGLGGDGVVDCDDEQIGKNHIPLRDASSGVMSKISIPSIFPRISRRSRPVACSMSVGMVPGAEPGPIRSASVLISNVKISSQHQDPGNAIKFPLGPSTLLAMTFVVLVVITVLMTTGLWRALVKSNPVVLPTATLLAPLNPPSPIARQNNCFTIIHHHCCLKCGCPLWFAHLLLIVVVAHHTSVAQPGNPGRRTPSKYHPPSDTSPPHRPSKSLSSLPPNTLPSPQSDKD